jgi:hypothetical protein
MSLIALKFVLAAIIALLLLVMVWLVAELHAGRRGK